MCIYSYMNIHMHLHIMYHTHICIPIYIQFHILIQYTSHTSIQHVYSLNFHIHVHKIYTHITLTHLYPHILSYMHTQHIPHTSHAHMYVVIPPYNTCTCMYTHIMVTCIEHIHIHLNSVCRDSDPHIHIYKQLTHMYTLRHINTHQTFVLTHKTHTYRFTHMFQMHRCAHITYEYIHLRSNTHTYIYTHVHAYTLTWVYTLIDTHVYIHIQSCTHAHVIPSCVLMLE